MALLVPPIRAEGCIPVVDDDNQLPESPRCYSLPDAGAMGRRTITRSIARLKTVAYGLGVVRHTLLVASMDLIDGFEGSFDGSMLVMGLRIRTRPGPLACAGPDSGVPRGGLAGSVAVSNHHTATL